MPAGAYFLGLRSKPKLKNGMDAVCRRSRAGRAAGVNHFLGFALQHPKVKNRKDADFHPRNG
jgi:hypothetical protein